ncbi:DUF4395 family protein [candidate division KSB1 bacterium]|nr:DUF4395 family protein [candidate division KSB1 bacterium]
MQTNVFKIRTQLEAQGFVGCNDKTLVQINFPLRLAPALCMLWVALGTYLASATLLWALMPFAALGAVLRGHPFDSFYNFGLRYLMGRQPLPRYGAPRRFGCAVMTVWLAVTGWAFQSGVIMLGYILGGIAIVLPLINVTTGFCVPSFVYGLLFGKPGSRSEADCGG